MIQYSPPYSLTRWLKNFQSQLFPAGPKMIRFSGAKSAMVSWWLLALVALFLWYRNENYDRAIAVFVFTLGLVQLIEYGIQSGTDPSQSGRALFITLLLQCLVLAIGVYVFINDLRNPDDATMTQNIVHTIAGWNLFLFSIVFVIGLIFTFVSPEKFSAIAIPDSESSTIAWFVYDRPGLDRLGWLYLLGIFVPLGILFGYYAWADPGIAILIVYGILAVSCVLYNYPMGISGMMWSYLSVGFAFLAWLIGFLPMITGSKLPSSGVISDLGPLPVG